MQHIILILLLALMPVTASAKIYKWVDEDGQVHYSQTPPSNAKAETVRTDKPAVDPQQAMDTLRTKDKGFQERREQRMLTEEEKATAAEEQKKKDERCAQLRKNMDTLTTNTRVQMQQEDGEFTTLTDEARLQQLDQTKKRMEKECQ